MLTRFHKILIGALAVQLVLIAIVLTRGDNTAVLKEHPILAGFDAAKVTRVQVFAGATAKPIDVVKRDAGWVLASGFDYPVEPTRVTDVLSPLAKLSAAGPVTTQVSRHKQLHVADDEFERKLVITAGGKDITLYLGSSAGARRTAFRIGGEDQVYGVTGLSATSVGSEPRQWLDPSYVKVPRDDISKLVVVRDGKTVELSRVAAPTPAPPAAGSAADAPPPAPPAADHWNASLGDAPIALLAGETLDETAITRLVSEVATIDLSAPADPKRAQAAPTATITIEHKPTATSTPAPTIIDVIADGTTYWVHDRSLSRAVMVDKSRLDDVVGIDRDKLVKKPPPPQSAAPGAGSAVKPARPGPAQPGPG